MLLHVDPRNGIALYEQIVRGVKFAVAAGLLRVEQLVPSVRELARQLAVNPNTVARAYRDLQVDQVLEPVRGEGLRVTPHAVARCREDRVRLIRERLRGVLDEAQQSGLTKAELRGLIRDELSSAEPEG